MLLEARLPLLKSVLAEDTGEDLEIPFLPLLRRSLTFFAHLIPVTFWDSSQVEKRSQRVIIAGTSITISDVVYVVDIGKVKEKRYDPERHMTPLGSAWWNDCQEILAALIEPPVPERVEMALQTLEMVNALDAGQ
ncbi:hypothetical protein BS47DRAFT_1481567 [Hydnum rufescens UP504]|uniref:Uncharacterized protein n=1 Tax=Hydnum rufescens UP504 TaxID=1448309 RepID=A0A9P6BAA0_9AGAM|nr:hypothetical protein BS47DRAFT_1481567 [Hydnum rufescens UP504]